MKWVISYEPQWFTYSILHFFALWTQFWKKYNRWRPNGLSVCHFKKVSGLNPMFTGHFGIRRQLTIARRANASVLTGRSIVPCHSKFQNISPMYWDQEYMGRDSFTTLTLQTCGDKHVAFVWKLGAHERVCILFYCMVFWWTAHRITPLNCCCLQPPS